jgi:hypothetical protein
VFIFSIFRAIHLFAYFMLDFITSLSSLYLSLLSYVTCVQSLPMCIDFWGRLYFKGHGVGGGGKETE